MKTLIAINTHSQYISNDTGEIVGLSWNDKLLSALYTNKYTFQEIFTIVAKFSAKTTKELNLLVDQYEATNPYPQFYVRTDLINK